MTRRIAISIIMSLSCCLVVIAQQLRTIDSRQGLPDNSVNCIEQDSLGFVWMGTSNGLARYDGMRFVTYRHDRKNPSSLNNNNIHHLKAVAGGLYVATNIGVDFLSFRDGLFHHCLTDGKSAEGRANGFADIDGTLYCVFESGLMYRIDGCILKPFASSIRAYAMCRVGDNLFVLSQGKVLLVSTLGKVLAQCATDVQGKFRPMVYASINTGLVYVSNGFGSVSRAYSVEGGKIEPAGLHVPDALSSVADYDGGVAFGIDGNGVLIQNGYGQTVLNSDNGLSGDAVYSLCADHKGNLWVGTYRTGANMYTKTSQAMRLYESDVATAVVVRNGKIYAGLDGGGLCVIDKASGNSQTYTAANSRMPGDNVISMTADDDFLWMAVYGKGLVRYSFSDSSLTTVPLPEPSRQGDMVWCICDDGKGNIWAGGMDVCVVSKRDLRVSHIKTLQGLWCSSLCSKGGYVWIAHRGGVSKIDASTHNVVRRYDSQLPDSSIMYAKIDSKERIWMSFKFDDLMCMDSKTMKVKHYGSRQGLKCTSATSILEDGEGRLWMGTENGMYCLIGQDGLFVRIDGDEGMPNTYTWDANCIDGDRAYWGTTKGVVCIDNRQAMHSGTGTKVWFSSLDVMDGAAHAIGSQGKPQVRLTHDENFFTIAFTVPEYNNPHRLCFAYYLKGLEDGWREMTSARKVDYTNVPSGKYEFMVRCLGVDGKWGEPSVLHITILPPWYLTWWAKLLWTLLAIGTVVFGVKAYLHNLDMRHKVELAEIEKESDRRLNDAKMNFYTSITHELRTPVFLITAQLEEILEQAKDTVKVPSTYLAMVLRNAKRLTTLINRVVDFRKVGAENLRLNTRRDDIVAFCRSMTSTYADMFRQKGIEYDFSTTANEVMLDYDPLKLELIVSNLITNAFKYTPNGGRVVMSLSDEPDRVTISIKDNGIGIDEKVRDTIFESFFRSERGKRQSKGDGLGLSYVKNLVELHGGAITVDSDIGKGSTFTFYIPKHEHDAPVQASLVASIPGMANPTATFSVLIIDDEPDTVQLLEHSLERDFRVDKAYDGEQGLAKARATLPDIIICDMMMPKIDGLDFLRQLKTDKKLCHIKVIVFTAITSEENMLEAFDRGADAYLTKPISLRLLRKRIDRMLRQTDNASLIAGMTMAKGETDGNANEKAPEPGRRQYTKEEQVFLLRCRELIDENIGDPDFGIEFMADSLAMSHSTLYKKLKSITGMSLIEFINDYKIYKAVTLFRQGETNIEAVSTACGINDPKHFRTLFKRKMGMAPKQFVQNL